MASPIDEKLLNSIVRQIEKMRTAAAPAGLMSRRISQMGHYDEGDLVFDKRDLEVGQLYAGLSVLCRDALKYEHRPAAKVFDQVTTQVNKIDSKRYGGGAFPDYMGLPTDTLPDTLTRIEKRGYQDLSALGNPKIVHEWTFKPGKRLLLKFAAKFKKTICEKDGPYEASKNNLFDQKTLPATIATSILNEGFSAATFWYPLAVYIALLLIKTGLAVYCEE